MADIEYISSGSNPALEGLISGITEGLNSMYEQEEQQEEFLGRALPYLISEGLVVPTKDPSPDMQVAGLGFNYSTPLPDYGKQLEMVKMSREIMGTDPKSMLDMQKYYAQQFDFYPSAVIDELDRIYGKNAYHNESEYRSKFVDVMTQIQLAKNKAFMSDPSALATLGMANLSELGTYNTPITPNQPQVTPQTQGLPLSSGGRVQGLPGYAQAGTQSFPYGDILSSLAAGEQRMS